MKTLTFESRDAWLTARVGKITGTGLKDIVTKRGTGKKIGYYELIAARMGISDNSEDPMERGKRLESEAITVFEGETGKSVNTDLAIWVRDDNVNIAVSPDGSIGVTEAIEVECLSSANHIKAAIENKLPEEYEFQRLQYFIVNDELETLYFVMYDPRIPAKPYLCFDVHRADVQKEVDLYLAYQRETLAEVEHWVEQLSGF